MTRIFFVRHAQPEHSWNNDRTRPLTKEGIKDVSKVVDFFKTRQINCFYSSPYTRSIQTIESIHMVQERNIAALTDILRSNEGKVVVIGTHGTALSSMLNYYDNMFNCESFLRIIDWMPYIIELNFKGAKYMGKIEHLFMIKEFQGIVRADQTSKTITI